MNNKNNPIKRKRKQWDVLEKIEIIKKYNDGKKTSELAIEYNTTTSTISTIIHPDNQKKLIKEYEENNVKPNQKRFKAPTYEKVDEAVLIW